VHRSSRYAALRAAADGTYGFSACVIPLASDERAVADAIIALLPDARVAIATDDVSLLPEPLPEGFVAFPNADFVAGRLPLAWLDSLRSDKGDVIRERSGKRADAAGSERRTRAAGSDARAGTSARSDATRRLRAIRMARWQAPADVRAVIDDELAWYRASGIGFALVIMRVDSARLQAAKLAIENAVRGGDTVSLSDESIAIILPGVDDSQVAAIIKRAIKGIAGSRGKGDAAQTGVAVGPNDGDDASALLAAARERAKI